MYINKFIISPVIQILLCYLALSKDLCCYLLLTLSCSVYRPMTKYKYSDIKNFRHLHEVFGMEFILELVISTQKPKGSLYLELKRDRVEWKKTCDLYTFLPTVFPTQSIISKALFREFSSAYTLQWCGTKVAKSCSPTVRENSLCMSSCLCRPRRTIILSYRQRETQPRTGVGLWTSTAASEA